MTLINLSTLMDALGGPVPVDAVLAFTATRPRATGAVVVANGTVTVRIVAGVPTEDVDLVPSGVDWAYKATLSVSSIGRRIDRTVAVPDVPSVEWADLVDVDPATLLPAESAVPAWTAAVGQVAGLLADTVVARDAATAAQGLSEDARDAAVLARGIAEGARDGAVVAQGASEAARDQAQVYAANTVALQDTAFTALIADEDSATRAQLSATIGAAVSKPARTVAALGDSITEGGYNPALPHVAGGLSYATFIGIRSMQRLRLALNAGIGGQNTALILGRVPDVVAVQPDVCIVLGGTNDVLQSIAPATTISNLDQIVTALRAAGVEPILGTLPPMPAPNTATARQLTLRIQDYARTTGVKLIDFYAVLADPATDLWKTGYGQPDNVHPWYAGVVPMADEAIRVILDGTPITGPGVYLPVSNADPVNISTNALMLTDSNADGVADGWTKAGTGPGLATIQAVADVPGGKMQQLARTSGSGETRLLGRVTPPAASAGDVYAVVGRFRASVAGLNVDDYIVECGWFTSSAVITGTGIRPLGNAFRGDITDGVFYAVIGTKPGDAVTAGVRIALTNGTPTVKVTQFGVLNLTALGLS